MADEVVWTGESGTRYTYYVNSWPISCTNAEPGNYIFCKLNAQNQWEPIYIGQTGDLSERFDSHHACLSTWTASIVKGLPIFTSTSTRPPRKRGGRKSGI